MPEGISISIRSGVKSRIPGPKAPSPPAISKPGLMKTPDGGAPLRERMLARRNDDYSTTMLPGMLFVTVLAAIIVKAPLAVIAGGASIALFAVHPKVSSPRAIVGKFFRKLTRHPEAKFEEALEYRRLLDSGLISEDAYQAALKKLYRHLPELEFPALSATEIGHGKVK